MIKIGEYMVDASISEEHEGEAEATQYPIEDGSNVSDHVRVMPKTWRVSGIISDTPIGAIVAFRANASLKPSEEGRAYLESVLNAAEPVTVLTKLRTYDNMVMVGLSFSVDEETGDSLMFDAAFQQIVIETNKRVTVRVAAPRNGGKKDLGDKAAYDAGWIGNDAKGRKVLRKSIPDGAGGEYDYYTREDGAVVTKEEAAAAARRQDSVLITYGPDGKARPVDPKDYKPYTPKDKKPYYAPHVLK